MNILWISHNVPYPPKTGVLQRNYNLLREASKHGNIYLVAVLKENILPVQYNLGEATRELGRFCKHIDIIHLPIESSRVRLYAAALASLVTEHPLSVNWVKSRQMEKTIDKLVAEVPFDVAHYDTISLALYQTRTPGMATVLNHHNIESALLWRRIKFERNPVKRIYYGIEAEKLGKYEREVCPSFDTNFVVSALDGERLKEIAPEVKIDIIANGVDIDFFKNDAMEPRPGSLIMASGMNWFPNRDAVLYMHDEIWPLLTQNFTDISWIVVGASPPQQVLDLAEQDSRVTVTGFVDDVRPYLAEAEIYLCPMRDGGGTRLKILDAMSMGKAVVATSMACEGIDVTPERNVLIADTPSEFVSQISILRSDPALRKHLGKEARRFVSENYSWSVIGHKLGAVYRRLTRKLGEPQQ